MTSAPHISSVKTESNPAKPSFGTLVLLATIVLIVPLWLASGVSVGQSLAAIVAWVWTVLVPGWVLTRAIRGQSRSWLTEFALSAGVGTVVSTVVWLALVAAGWTGVLLAWPLVTLLLLLVRKDEILDFRPFEHPLDTFSGLAVSFALAMGYRKISAGLFAPTPLPRGAIGWYQDTSWHLGLAHELGRAMPPTDPQVFGSTFWYHWFANAHSAALAGASSVDPIVVFTRIWQPLVTVTVILLLFAAAEVLTKRIWPGLVATIVGYSSGITFSWFAFAGLDTMSIPFSPSHQWALVPLLLCVIAVCDLLENQRSTSSVLLFSVGALGLMGGKSSSLPVIICGLLLVLVLGFFIHRALVGPLGLMLVIAGIAFTISTILTSTANSGGEIQVLASIDLMEPWKLHLQDYAGRPEPQPWIPGITYNDGTALLLILLAGYVVATGATWLGLPLLRKRLSAWFLLGVGFAGFMAMMLVQVSGESQLYFMRGALPAWALLAAAGASSAWAMARRHASRHNALAVVSLATGLGAIAAVTISNHFVAVESPDMILSASSAPLFAYLVCVAVVAGATLIVARHHVWLALTGFMIGGQGLGIGAFLGGNSDQFLIISAVIVVLASIVAIIGSRSGRAWLPASTALAVAGLLLLGSVVELGTAFQRALGPQPESARNIQVSAAEVAATAWASEELPDDAVLATNVHCDTAPEREACPVLGFWVSALSGKRAFIGAWPYTAEAHAMHGEAGLSSRQQPFHDAERFALNQRAFTAPSQEVLDELVSLGATHLFAVENRTDVDPALDSLAIEVFKNEEVTIYELRR